MTDKQRQRLAIDGAHFATGDKPTGDELHEFEITGTVRVRPGLFPVYDYLEQVITGFVDEDGIEHSLYVAGRRGVG